MAPGKSSSGSKCEPIAPTGDKRHIRRDGQGRIEEGDDVGRSLPQDVRKRAGKDARSGQGDRGDHRR